MAAITYEIGGNNTKLRQSLKDSKAAVRDFRADLKNQTRQMHADAQQAGGGKGLFGAVLGGNLVAAGIAKVGAAAAAAVGDVGDLVDAAEQFGVSAESIGKMQRVMEGSGVKVEELRKAFQKLNDVQSAAKGGDAGATSKLAELGISMKEIQELKVDELFLRVSDGLAAMSDEGRAATVALDLVGSKSKRMVDTMRKGGDAMRSQMKDVTGAVSDDAAKNVDDAADKAQSVWSATKGGAMNLLGGAVGIAKHVAGEFEKGVAGYKADGTPDAAAAPPLTEEQQKMAAKDQRDSAEKAKQAAGVKRLHAMAEAARIANGDKDAAEAEKKLAALNERWGSADKDRADTLRKPMTFGEKYEEARKEVLKRDAEARSGKFDKHEAGANLAEAKAKFEDVKQTAIERAAMPLADQQNLAREEKAQAKQRAAGERAMMSRERDRIDRSFRQGKIKKDERDAQMAALGVGAGNAVADTQLSELKTISQVLKKAVTMLQKI